MHRSVRLLFSAAALAALGSAPASAQQSVPPASPTIGASGGVTGGIAIPIGRLSENHAAGYALGGLVDFSAAEQPFSFRGEVIYQRYDKKRNAPPGVGNKNLLSLGLSLLARSPAGASSGYVIGGIAVYRVSDEGTRPGVNAGIGLEVPLTYFIGIAELRLHYVMTEGRPAFTLPITVGARF